MVTADHENNSGGPSNLSMGLCATVRFVHRWSQSWLGKKGRTMGVLVLSSWVIKRPGLLHCVLLDDSQAWDSSAAGAGAREECWLGRVSQQRP